jgi:hypothetical protein
MRLRMNNTLKELHHKFCVNSDYREVWNIKVKDIGLKIGIPTSALQLSKENPSFNFFDLVENKTFSFPYSSIEDAVSESECRLVLNLPSPVLFWSKYGNTWSLLSSGDYTIKVADISKESEDEFSWGITDWGDYPEHIEKGVATSLEEAKLEIEKALVDHGMANGNIRKFKAKI